MKAIKIATSIVLGCTLIGSTASMAEAITCPGSPRNWPAFPTLDSITPTCQTTKGTMTAQVNSDGTKITGALLTAGTTPGAAAFTIGLLADGITTITSCQAVDVMPVDGNRARNTGSCQTAVKWRGSLRT